jgi:hypothetical protein
VIAHGLTTTSTEPLPVRTRCSDAELALRACWMDDHGDPGEWPEDVCLGYAAAVATARAEGRL